MIFGFLGWCGFIRIRLFGTAIFISIGITKRDLEVILCFIFMRVDVLVE